MKRFKMALFFLLALLSCKDSTEPDSVQEILNTTDQTVILQKLRELTGEIISVSKSDDSLAFLILPIQASCPACRNKTIDSIIKYRNGLPKNHFIIISANGGRKTINSFFMDRGSELPEIPTQLVLDSNNRAFRYDLYYDKPTIYYAYKSKVYKKVSSIPSTVRQDLRSFFSGR
jgi:hypothetical protein